MKSLQGKKQYKIQLSKKYNNEKKAKLKNDYLAKFTPSKTDYVTLNKTVTKLIRLLLYNEHIYTRLDVDGKKKND